MEEEIEILIGTTIDDAVELLLKAKDEGKHVYINFTGHILHSDTVSYDSAHMEIQGMTKAEYDKMKEKMHEDYVREEAAAKNAEKKIPYWIQRGQKLMFPEKYEEWDRCVAANAYDLYNGRVLDDGLDIMQALEDGISIDEAKKMLDGRSSGMYESIVRKIVFRFSRRGPEFWEATASDEISSDMKRIPEEMNDRNDELAIIHSSPIL